MIMRYQGDFSSSSVQLIVFQYNGCRKQGNGVLMLKMLYLSAFSKVGQLRIGKPIHWPRYEIPHLNLSIS